MLAKVALSPWLITVYRVAAKTPSQKQQAKLIEGKI